MTVDIRTDGILTLADMDKIKNRPWRTPDMNKVLAAIDSITGAKGSEHHPWHHNGYRPITDEDLAKLKEVTGASLILAAAIRTLDRIKKYA